MNWLKYLVNGIRRKFELLLMRVWMNPWQTALLIFLPLAVGGIVYWLGHQMMVAALMGFTTMAILMWVMNHKGWIRWW